MTKDDKLLLGGIIIVVLCAAAILLLVHFSPTEGGTMYPVKSPAQLTKINIDLTATMDEITSHNPEMKARDMRQKICDLFRNGAAIAKWDFLHDTWPIVAMAARKSINSTEENEVMNYIAALEPYCEH